MRGLARIAGRNSTIPAGSITTLDVTGYKGLLSGKESCILVKPLGDQTPHGLIIASTLSSFHGKHVKVQEMWDNNMSGFTHESELALCVQFPVSRKTTGTSASHNSLSVKISFTTKMKKLQSTNSPLSLLPCQALSPLVIVPQNNKPMWMNFWPSTKTRS